MDNNQRMKIVILILCIMLMIITFTKCGKIETTQNTVNAASSKELEFIYKGFASVTPTTFILRDNEYGIEYIVVTEGDGIAIIPRYKQTNMETYNEVTD